MHMVGKMRQPRAVLDRGSPYHPDNFVKEQESLVSATGVNWDRTILERHNPGMGIDPGHVRTGQVNAVDANETLSQTPLASRPWSWFKRLAIALVGLAYPIIANFFLEDCLVGLGIAPTRTPSCTSPDFNMTLLIATLETFISQELQATLSYISMQTAVPAESLVVQLQSRLEKMEETIAQLSEAAVPQLAGETGRAIYRADHYNFATEAKLDITTTHPRPSFPRMLYKWLPLHRGIHHSDNPRVLFSQDSRVQDVWMTSGPEAQIGFVLRRPIVLSAFDLTLATNKTHLNRTILPCNPHSVTLWGLIDGRDNFKTWNQYIVESNRLTERAQDLPHLFKTASTPDTHYIPLVHLLMNSTPGDDGNNVYERRLSEVYPEVDVLGMDFGVFILRVEGLPGTSELCLGRIGLYGTRSPHTLLSV